MIVKDNESPIAEIINRINQDDSWRGALPIEVETAMFQAAGNAIVSESLLKDLDGVLSGDVEACYRGAISVMRAVRGAIE